MVISYLVRCFNRHRKYNDDVTIDGTKTVTASFEEIIAIVLDPDGISARGVGKWKIKKRTSLSGASKGVSSQAKSMNDPCEIYEVIFRSDGTFTMVSAVIMFTLTIQRFISPSKVKNTRYENVVLTESVMSFTLIRMPKSLALLEDFITYEITSVA